MKRWSNSPSKTRKPAELVKLHFFAGLPLEQAAELLGLSARTAYRNWNYARAWLFRRLDGGAAGQT